MKLYFKPQAKPWEWLEKCKFGNIVTDDEIEILFANWQKEDLENSICVI